MVKKRWLAVIGLSIVIVIVYAHDRTYYRDTVPFLAPINFDGDVPIRCDELGDGEFGASRKGGRTHKGLDILAEVGAPARAAKSGWVAVGNVPDGMGKYVRIRHRGGLVTIYGHLSKINVRRWQKVRQGDIVGETGKTGNANHPAIVPHLHFEVRNHGSSVDPLGYLESSKVRQHDEEAVVDSVAYELE